MKEIVVISGKGGTGKTTVAASFAKLAKSCVIADCDVDAADLHLLLKPQVIEKYDFYGGKVAEIQDAICSKCNKCYELCRFDAVKKSESNHFSIDELACEGCGVCVRLCPENAIIMKDALNGEWYFSQTRMGKFIHAKLGVSGENSGKLVTTIRKRAKSEAEKDNAEFLIIDGSPGIGCPVIASLTGADFAVIVTEPTVSGIHDLERIVKLTKHFKINSGVIINRCTINPEKTEEIKKFASSRNLAVLGEMPNDSEVTDAQIAGQTIVEYSNGEMTKTITEIWSNICKIL
jgi:MinD superfamily P-loop ATPase